MDVLETMAAAKENATKIVQDFQKELILSVTKHEKRCSNCLKTSLTETWRICRGNYFCSECRNKGFTCAKLKIHQGDRCADTYRYPDDALVTLMNQLPRLCRHHNNGCKEIQEKEKNNLYKNKNKQSSRSAVKIGRLSSGNLDGDFDYNNNSMYEIVI